MRGTTRALPFGASRTSEGSLMAAAWPESIGVGPVVLDGVLLVGRSTRQRLSTSMAHTAESESRPLGDEAYLARLKVLRQQRDVIVERRACGLPGERANE